jgi:hypothetical protein
MLLEGFRPDDRFRVKGDDGIGAKIDRFTFNTPQKVSEKGQIDPMGQGH